MRAPSCRGRLSSCQCLPDLSAFSDRRHLLTAAQSTTSRDTTPHPGSSGKWMAATGRDERAGRGESEQDDYHSGRSGTGWLNATSRDCYVLPSNGTNKSYSGQTKVFVASCKRGGQSILTRWLRSLTYPQPGSTSMLRFEVVSNIYESNDQPR